MFHSFLLSSYAENRLMQDTIGSHTHHSVNIWLMNDDHAIQVCQQASSSQDMGEGGDREAEGRGCTSRDSLVIIIFWRLLVRKTCIGSSYLKMNFQSLFASLMACIFVSYALTHFEFMHQATSIHLDSSSFWDLVSLCPPVLYLELGITARQKFCSELLQKIFRNSLDPVLYLSLAMLVKLIPGQHCWC